MKRRKGWLFFVIFYNVLTKIGLGGFLTSQKYGGNVPSGISHFCLSSKWHFFVIFYQFLPKNGFGGFLTSNKYGGNVPSGISHFCLILAGWPTAASWVFRGSWASFTTYAQTTFGSHFFAIFQKIRFF